MPRKNNKELLKNNYNTILILIIVFSLVILLFRNILNYYVESLLLLLLLFSSIMLVTKNLYYSIFSSIVLFLLFNLLNRQKKYIESFKNTNFEEFQNNESEEEELDPNTKYKNKLDSIDDQIEKYKNDPKIKKSAENIQEFLKKLNGNIELKSSDIEESEPLNVDTEKYSDDKKFNALKAAQKETYQLIDSVSALKDTVTTLQPILSQGKELMGLFQNFKF